MNAKTALDRFVAGLQRLVDAAKGQSNATITDSQQAIAEHAALVAVAEAAKTFGESFTMKLADGFAPKMDLDLMRKALANLAAIRGGAK